MDIIKSIEHEQLKSKIPNLKIGDTVKVSVKIKEGNRERIQVFEGIIIKKQGGGVNATFTVRKISYGVGVEKTFLLHSPLMEKVEVVRVGKARRAKLLYLRKRLGKAAKTKEKAGARIETKEITLKEEIFVPEEGVAEEATAEEVAEVAETVAEKEAKEVEVTEGAKTVEETKVAKTTEEAKVDEVKDESVATEKTVEIPPVEEVAELRQQAEEVAEAVKKETEDTTTEKAIEEVKEESATEKDDEAVAPESGAPTGEKVIQEVVDTVSEEKVETATEVADEEKK